MSDRLSPLSNEIIYLICSYLSIDDITRCRRLSMHFYLRLKKIMSYPSLNTYGNRFYCANLYINNPDVKLIMEAVLNQVLDNLSQYPEDKTQLAKMKDRVKDLQVSMLTIMAESYTFEEIYSLAEFQLTGLGKLIMSKLPVFQQKLMLKIQELMKTLITT